MLVSGSIARSCMDTRSVNGAAYGKEKDLNTSPLHRGLTTLLVCLLQPK